MKTKTKIESKIKKLARWYNTFNNWKYPDDFPIPKPSDWESIPNASKDRNARTKHSILTPYMYAIVFKIGHKECLRCHHLHNIGVRNIQFEVWWIAGKISNFIRRMFLPNFYFDIYTFFRWRREHNEAQS